MKFKILSSIVILFMLVMLFSGCGFQTELEGSWVGCEVRRPLIDWTLTVVGNQFSLVREDSGLWYRGLLRLNKNCRLMKIDLQISDTSVPAISGKTALGIFEIDGDTLTIVSSEPGNHLRPRSFDEFGKSIAFYFTKN